MAIFLIWYNDQIYALDANNTIKPLPTFYYNEYNCQSEKPDFLKTELFIQTLSIKYTKTIKEWIACKIAALKE